MTPLNKASKPYSVSPAVMALATRSVAIPPSMPPGPRSAKPAVMAAAP